MLSNLNKSILKNFVRNDLYPKYEFNIKLINYVKI